MFYGYLILVLLVGLFSFIIYLIFDLASTDPNSFQNKWAKKTLWMWLPFYALWRLIREMILGQK